MEYELTDEGREILDLVERGELVRVANPEQEKEYAMQAARNTLKKMKRAKEQKSDRDPELTHPRSRE